MVIMSWTDKRLRWKLADNGYIRKIRAEKSQVWIPDVEVVNRLHDFSPFDEKASRVHVYYDGRVVNTRLVPSTAVLVINQPTFLHKTFLECFVYVQTSRQVYTHTHTIFKLLLSALLQQTTQCQK